MTIARTALRLCVSAALKGEKGARPTIAQERIYDSRISDIAPEEYSEDAKPVVIVLTDNDEGDALSKQNGGPPFRRNIDVVIEIGMVARAPLLDENGEPEGFTVGYPDTDARLEASMDMLEFQIIRRLAYDQAEIPTLFRRIARIWKYTCHRQVEDTPGVKIAARLLTLTCETTDDRVLIMNSGTGAVTGIDALPEPLCSVAKILPEGSSGHDIVVAIADALSPLSAPPLDGVDMTVDAAPDDEGVPPIKAPINLSRT